MSSTKKRDYHFKRYYSVIGCNVYYKIDANTRQIRAYCNSPKEEKNLFCGCNAKLTDKDIRFYEQSPCPLNCTKAKICQKHFPKMGIQTSPELMKKGIDCAFCYYEKNQDEHYDQVVKFARSPISDKKSYSIYMNSDKDDYEHCFMYIGKYIVLNPEAINKNKRDVTFLGEKILERKQQPIRSKESIRALEISNKLSIYDPAKEPEEYIKNFSKVFNDKENEKFWQDRFSNYSASGYVFIVSSEEEDELFVVKISQRKFDRKSIKIEEAQRFVFEENEYQVRSTNNAHALAGNAPKVHAWTTTIGSYQKKVIVSKSFFLTQFIDGTSLYAMKGDKIDELYPDEDLSRTEKYFKLYWKVYRKELHKLHGMENFHGDLNPSNIIVKSNPIAEDLIDVYFIDFTRRKAFIVEKETNEYTWKGLMFDSLTHVEKNDVKSMIDILTSLLYFKWVGPSDSSSPRMDESFEMTIGELDLEGAKKRDGACLYIILQELFLIVRNMKKYSFTNNPFFSALFHNITDFIMISGHFDQIEVRTDIIKMFSKITILGLKREEKESIFLNLHNALFRDCPREEYLAYTTYNVEPKMQPIWYLSFTELMGIAY